MEVPDGVTVIEPPGYYPHLFVRAQVKSRDDLPNVCLHDSGADQADGIQQHIATIPSTGLPRWSVISDFRFITRITRPTSRTVQPKSRIWWVRELSSLLYAPRIRLESGYSHFYAQLSPSET
jgi:hypothetical protein